MNVSIIIEFLLTLRFPTEKDLMVKKNDEENSSFENRSFKNGGPTYFGNQWMLK